MKPGGNHAFPSEFEIKHRSRRKRISLIILQDNESNSIQSLLALLRSTQDGTPTADPAAATHPASNVEDRSSQAPLRSLSRGNSGTVQHAQPSSAIPSTQQLNDILSSLNGSRAPSRPDVAPHQSSESAAKVSRNRMEPFGPMMNLQASPSKRKSTSQDVSAQSEHSSRTITIEKAAGATSSGISAAVDEDKSSMSFAKALPKLGEMMGDERFMSELRKVSIACLAKYQDADLPDERRTRCLGEAIMGKAGEYQSRAREVVSGRTRHVSLPKASHICTYERRC